MQWINPAKLFLLMAVFAIAAIPFGVEATCSSCLRRSADSSYSAAAPSYGEYGYQYGSGDYGYPGQPGYGQVTTKTPKSKNQSPKSKPTNQ
jgi:hypothetical protein